MAQIMIEILSDRPTVERQVRVFDQAVVAIGRGYHNDLILTDPYVSLDHCLLSVDFDGIKLKDCQNENGLLLNNKTLMNPETYIKFGDVLTLGRTRLKIVHPSLSVETTKRFNRLGVLNDEAIRPSLVWLNLFLLVAWFLFDSYMNTFEKSSLGRLFSVSVGVVLSAVLWASVWALVGRMIKHRSLFLIQLFLTSVFILGIELLEIPCVYLGFLTGVEAIEKFLESGVFVGLFVWLLVYQMGVATHVSFIKRIIASLCVCGVCLGLGFLTFTVIKEANQLQPEYYSVLKPPFFRVKQGQPIDPFMDQAKDVFKQDRQKSLDIF